MTEHRKPEAQPAEAGLAVCPQCGRPGPRDAAVGTGELARCPEHQLAFVEESALDESGRDPMLGRTIAGRFVVLSLLGAGSMGAVFRARQEAVGRDVALKIVRRDRVYDQETKVRFEREARAMSALSSPHTVTVFDFGEVEDGALFLAMEMLRGETLGQRLRREKYVDWAEGVRFAIHALRSLAEAHREGIIHRDLKPDNLFLMRGADGEDESCKVLDFGIAKLERDEYKVDQLETQAGTVFGTPRYMSPEQAQGSALDARSDLYTLGVIMFQMLTGRAPFLDEDAVVVMARHIKDEPPRFEEIAAERHIPDELEKVVRRALEKEPDERMQSADEFIRALEAVREARPRKFESTTNTKALVPVSTTGARRTAKRAGHVLPVAILAGVAVLTFAVVYAWRQSPDATRDLSSTAEPPVRARPAAPTLSEPTPAAQVEPTTEPPAGVGSIRDASQAKAGLLPNPRQAEKVGPTTRRAKPAPASSTMEPKRPDERYGRFR